MTEKAWRRRMGRRAVALVPLGALLLGVGASLAGGDGMAGYLVGSLGVVLLVVGALCAKFAAFGPVPNSVQGVL